MGVVSIQNKEGKTDQVKGIVIEEMVWGGKIKESASEYNLLTSREILLLKLFKNLPERKQKALIEFLSGN